MTLKMIPHNSPVSIRPNKLKPGTYNDNANNLDTTFIKRLEMKKTEAKEEYKKNHTYESQFHLPNEKARPSRLLNVQALIVRSYSTSTTK